MPKVIIIDHEPLTLRRIEIFYIRELRSYGIEIEFWDMSSYFHPGMEIVDTIQTDYAFVVPSLEVLKTKLSGLDIEKCVFIIEAFHLYAYRKFFKLLNDYKCYKIKMELYASTMVDSRSFLYKLKSVNIRDLMRAVRIHGEILLNKWYDYRHRITPYDLYISSGSNPSIQVHINHPDWEKAQDCPCFCLENPEPYAVFCDEYFPLHPDLRYFENIKIDRLEEYTRQYQNSLCDFFDKVEKAYKVKVLIAAHPKSDYEAGAWGGRSIYKYKTCELIKGCEFVLFHSSTSISFAYIFNKPLVMLTTPLYKKVSSLYRYQVLTSQQLKLKIYNIEDKEEVRIEPIPPEIRKNYIYKYLTAPEVENKRNPEILLNTLSVL